MRLLRSFWSGDSKGSIILEFINILKNILAGWSVYHLWRFELSILTRDGLVNWLKLAHILLVVDSRPENIFCRNLGLRLVVWPPNSVGHRSIIKWYFLSIISGYRMIRNLLQNRSWRLDCFCQLYISRLFHWFYLDRLGYINTRDSSCWMRWEVSGVNIWTSLEIRWWKIIDSIK